MTPMDPERYHVKNHSDGAVPFADCRRCQRAQAICHSKRRFATWEEAEARAREINEGTAYARPMARYRCRWCPCWHLTTARTKVRVKRAEKQRRKWLRREAA